MFERFTDRARRVVVCAQEEARALGHSYIGTEHLLLGILREPDGLGARALGALGVTYAASFAQVEGLVGRGPGAQSGHVPFTPRAKKVLELSLREAQGLGHNYIGTEHIALGLVREGGGAGAEVLTKQVPAPVEVRVRAAVLDLVSAARATEGGAAGAEERPVRPGTGDPEPPATRAGAASLAAARRLARPDPLGSQHLLLASLEDPSSAAAKALAGLGVDLERARDAARRVDPAGTSDEVAEEAGRRTMTLRLEGDTLTLSSTDPTLVNDLRTALEALAGSGPELHAIEGAAPTSRGLADVWRALHGACLQIAARAGAQSAPPERGKGEVPEPSEEKPAERVEGRPGQWRPSTAGPAEEQAH